MRLKMQSDNNLPHTADIRQFLTEAFSDEELITLAFDYFTVAYDDFASGMTKQQKIQLLLEYCQRRQVIPNLLAAIQRTRPEQYKKQFAQPPIRDSHQVFISHTHQDAHFAHRLASDLIKHSWHIWIAPESIRPGEKWVEAIKHGLGTSGIYVLILTPAAIRSGWVKDETTAAIELAHQGQMKFILLDVENCEVPPLWQSYQQISFRDRYEAGLDALLGTLEAPYISSVKSIYRPDAIIKKYDSLRPLRVFLCHSSHDKHAVRSLHQQLRAEGIDSWLDEEKLLPGQKWEQEIPKAIRAADIVIVCLSRESVSKAGYVQKEIKYALDVADEQPEGTIYLIPLRLEECIVPDRLGPWHWVNLFDERGLEKLMRSLRARANSLGLTTTPVER
jgi:hypothetical protein